jgi:hypothetical protein
LEPHDKAEAKLDSAGSCAVRPQRIDPAEHLEAPADEWLHSGTLLGVGTWASWRPEAKKTRRTLDRERANHSSQ